MQFYVEQCPIEEYEAHKEERLMAEELEEHQLFHLVMRCEGRGPDALRAPVFVHTLTRFLGRTAFQVIYTNRDLQPVTRGHKSKLADGYWKPHTPLPLKSPGIRAISRIGYFLPYQTKLDDEFWVMSEKISPPSTF